MRAFYVTAAPALAVILFALGCGEGSPSRAAVEPSRKELEAALDSIEQWLGAAQPEKAEVVARGLVASQPNFAPGHAALGRILLVKVGAALNANLPERAESIALESLAQFKEAVRLGDTSPEVIRGAGIAAEQSGQLQEAIQWYAAGADSDEATALYLGLALLRADRPEDAIALIEPMRERRPGDPFLQATYADCLAAIGRNEEAHAALLQAIGLAPDEPAFRIRRAALLRRDGHALLAAETILALPEEFRTTAQATEELTAALLEVNQLDLLAEAWADHARANPDSATAMELTIRSYINAGKRSEAELWIDILLTKNPTNPNLEELRSELNEGVGPRPEE